MTLILDGTLGVSGVAGSASAPAVVGSDADSGYYINSANEPSASVNGTAVWNAASTFGFKNRLINGQMQINQRAITTLNPTNGEYSLDRWKCFQSTSGKYTVQSSTTAPGGFTNSALITSSAATTLGATDYNLFQQSIEVANFADMQWGTASASPVTVSFWVRSSLTGTFGGSLRTASSTYNYPFSYTISAANTWEYKTVTIPGPTSGSWGSTLNDGAVQVAWSLGVGSTYSGTANAWTGTSNIFQPTGSTSVVSTNGATWYITGVQIEKGSTATSFDFRSYGQELQLCQRYYQEFSSGSLGSYGGPGSSSFVSMFWYTGVTMRSTPSASLSTSSPSFTCQGVASITSSGVAPTGPTYSRNVITSNFAGNYSSGSSGQCVQWGSGYIAFSAEL